MWIESGYWLCKLGLGVIVLFKLIVLNKGWYVKYFINWKEFRNDFNFISDDEDNYFCIFLFMWVLFDYFLNYDLYIYKNDWFNIWYFKCVNNE